MKMAALKGGHFAMEEASVFHITPALRSIPCAIRLNEARRPRPQKMMIALKELSIDRVWTAAGVSASEIMLMFIPPLS